MKPFDVDVPDLTSALIELVRQVPRGSVTTYGDLATALGDRSAARWVAEALNDAPPALQEVAHRVVSATGEPGRSVPGALARLVREQATVDAGRVEVGHRFREFRTDAPLARLKVEQDAIAARVRLTALSTIPNTVAAVVMRMGRRRVRAASRIAASLSRPWRCMVLAKATIRMPFLAMRPTSVMRPIWL